MVFKKIIGVRQYISNLTVHLGSFDEGQIQPDYKIILSSFDLSVTYRLNSPSS